MHENTDRNFHLYSNSHDLDKDDDDHRHNSYFVTGTEVGLHISSFTLRHLLRGKLRHDCRGT